MKIDLHMHTTVSDGTDRPEELIARVREAGISIFSVTDHDAIKGAVLVAGLLADPGDGTASATPDLPPLRFLPGSEFSCKDAYGKYHILGYGYDPAAPAINALVNKGHRFRIEKALRRLDFLDQSFGFRFSREDQEAFLALDNPGKPHLANLMVQYGYAPDKDTAIKSFINKRKGYSPYFQPEEAISAILNSGGIPVLAHPAFGDGDQLILGEEMESVLMHLREYGLRGMEAFYSGFSPKIMLEQVELAERYGFLVTCGSDYHGRNKLVRLGDTGPWPYPGISREHVEELLAEFLAIALPNH
ncbi:MAG: PHP domain-containing protein [Firmicutes bacterium]|nr:PHP domain-containing protein [Bacillota bacterium]